MMQSALSITKRLMMGMKSILMILMATMSLIGEPKRFENSKAPNPLDTNTCAYRAKLFANGVEMVPVAPSPFTTASTTSTTIGLVLTA